MALSFGSCLRNGGITKHLPELHSDLTSVCAAASWPCSDCPRDLSTCDAATRGAGGPRCVFLAEEARLPRGDKHDRLTSAPQDYPRHPDEQEVHARGRLQLLDALGVPRAVSIIDTNASARRLQPLAVPRAGGRAHSHTGGLGAHWPLSVRGTSV